MGSLRTSMATCGYEDIPAFHKAEVMVAPALQSEGKQLQRSRRSGWAPPPRRSHPASNGVVGRSRPRSSCE